MQMTMREAKAKLAAAATAAAEGERVVITKHGKPFVELVPAEPVGNKEPFFEKLARVRRERGIEDHDTTWFDEFISNPEASRRVLGLED